MPRLKKAETTVTSLHNVELSVDHSEFFLIILVADAGEPSLDHLGLFLIILVANAGESFFDHFGLFLIVLEAIPIIIY